MIDDFDALSNWVNISGAANVALNTTTIKQGAGSLEFDKTTAVATTAMIGRALYTPIDLFTSWWTQGYLLRWHARHANWTGVASISVQLVWTYDAAGAPAKYTTYTLLAASLSAGAWATYSGRLANGTDTGSVSDEERMWLRGLQVTITTTVAGTTIADVLIDGLEVVPANGVAYPSLLVWNTYNRLLLPTFDDFSLNDQNLAVTNNAPRGMEVSQFGSFLIAQVGLMSVKSPTLWQGLRKFAQYSNANNAWKVARNASELVATTCDAASGFGQADPRVLYLTATVEIERLGVGCTLRVGPNTSDEWEFAEVLAITAGVSVTCKSPLMYAYVSGDRVQSAYYLPSAGRLDAAAPCYMEAAGGASLMLACRETS